MLGGALDDATKKVTNLQDAEKNLANTTYKLMFAGASIFSFGALMARGMFSFLDSTSKGAMLMESFGLAWDRFSSKLGSGIADAMQPDLEALMNLFRYMGDNQNGMNWLSVATWNLTKFMVVAGLGLFILNSFNSVLSQLAKFGSGLILRLVPQEIIIGLAMKSATALNALTQALAGIGITSLGGAFAWAIPITIVASLIGFELFATPEQKAGALKALNDTWSNLNQGRNTNTGMWSSASGNPSQYIDMDIHISGNNFGSDMDESKIGIELGDAVGDLINTGQYGLK